jgi:hypothetical protein
MADTSLHGCTRGGSSKAYPYALSEGISAHPMEQLSSQNNLNVKAKKKGKSTALSLDVLHVASEPLKAVGWA